MHFFEGLTKIRFGQFELVLEDDDDDDDDDKRHERRVKIFSQMIKKLTKF